VGKVTYMLLTEIGLHGPIIVKERTLMKFVKTHVQFLLLTNINIDTRFIKILTGHL